MKEDTPRVKSFIQNAQTLCSELEAPGFSAVKCHRMVWAECILQGGITRTTPTGILPTSILKRSTQVWPTSKHRSHSCRCCFAPNAVPIHTCNNANIPSLRPIIPSLSQSCQSSALATYANIASAKWPVLQGQLTRRPRDFVTCTRDPRGGVGPTYSSTFRCLARGYSTSAGELNTLRATQTG